MFQYFMVSESWWYVVRFTMNISLKMSDLTCFVFIAIKRQWSLKCILKLEGFAKTIGFLLCRDLQMYNSLLIACNMCQSYLFVQISY